MRRLLLLVLLSPLAVLFLTPPAVAHDATSTTYAEVTSTRDDVRVVLELEYDLLMKSAWLYAEAYDATDPAEQQRQLDRHLEAVSTYAIDRFQVANDDQRCAGHGDGTGAIVERNSRSFARLTLDYVCPNSGEPRHAFFSALFPDGEGFVHSTKTMVSYDVDGRAGAVVLETHSPQVDIASAPSRSVAPTTTSKAAQLLGFAKSGAEHLLLGPDHVLFLLALLLAVRGWKEVVLAATTFTVAHSVTFGLGSLGLVDVPASIVEPVIALSIVAMAVLGLLGRSHNFGRWHLPVAFGFGLLHGLGFASALGISEPGSWDLVWSLLAFNIGIEAAQVALILLVFPLLVAIRRTRVERQVLAGVAMAVIVVGVFWLVQRLPVMGELVARALPSIA